MIDLDELGKLREYLEDETVKHLIGTERDRSAFDDLGCRCVLCVSRHGLLAMMQQVRRSVRAHSTGAKLYVRATAERDAALAAVERVAALHLEGDWKCGNPRHTHPKIGCPECYTECETCDRTYPCDTRVALAGKEKNDAV